MSNIFEEFLNRPKHYRAAQIFIEKLTEKIPPIEEMGDDDVYAEAFIENDIIEEEAADRQDTMDDTYIESMKETVVSVAAVARKVSKLDNAMEEVIDAAREVLRMDDMIDIKIEFAYVSRDYKESNWFELDEDVDMYENIRETSMVSEGNATANIKVRFSPISN